RLAVYDPSGPEGIEGPPGALHLEPSRLFGDALELAPLPRLRILQRVVDVDARVLLDGLSCACLRRGARFAVEVDRRAEGVLPGLAGEVEQHEVWLRRSRNRREALVPCG